MLTYEEFKTKQYILPPDIHSQAIKKARQFSEYKKVEAEYVEAKKTGKPEEELMQLARKSKELYDERMHELCYYFYTVHPDKVEFPEDLSPKFVFNPPEAVDLVYRPQPPIYFHKPCPKCGGKLRDQGVVLTSNPPQIPYKCESCGEIHTVTGELTETTIVNVLC